MKVAWVIAALVFLPRAVNIPLPQGGVQRVRPKVHPLKAVVAIERPCFSTWLQLSGPGPLWSVQWSTNLVDWVEENIFISGPILVLDPGIEPQKFWRVITK